MRRLFTALSMCFGTFTVIPASHAYDEKLRAVALEYLPLAGAVIAALWGGGVWLALWLGLPAPIPAALSAALPLLLTGFIHLDGYMDVADAVLSRRGLEERRRILKDSHVGAFAVIALGLLLLFAFAVHSALLSVDGLWQSALPVFVMSRFSSLTAVKAFPAMEGSQYATLPKGCRWWSAVIVTAVFAAAVYFLWGLAALTGALMTVFAYWCFAFYAFKQLRGFNGDGAGFALTVAELFGVLAVVIMGGM